MFGKVVISFIVVLLFLISCSILIGTLDVRSYYHSFPMLKSPAVVATAPCTTAVPPPPLRVYMYDLPRRFNVGMLNRRSTSEAPVTAADFPPWPKNSGLKRQHSVEYWMMGSLLYGDGDRSGAIRVLDPELADVFFVPFFSSLSFNTHGHHMTDAETKIDRQLQIDLMEFLRQSKYWQRSGGRDHVFPMTHPNAFRFLRDQLNESIQVVVDFSRYPRSVSNLNKDVVSPYVHVVDSFTDDKPQDPFESRTTLLFFRGKTFRKDEGIVRVKLAKILAGYDDVHYERSIATGENIKLSSKGMRSSKFCLHPAGDTPSSCRLFDAIVSHCVPVIVSDQIELPFEDEIDYSQFSVFFSFKEALEPGYMINQLRKFPKQKWTVRPQTSHPLDPLSAAEISVAVATVRAAGATPEVRDSMRFIEVDLVEPEKQVVALADAYFFPPFQPSLLPRSKGGPVIPTKLPPRKARLVVYNKRSNETSIWIVELTEVHATTRGGHHRGKVISSTVVPDVQPPMDAVEYAECEAVVKDFPPFREAMKKRGIEDMDLVMVDPWCAGYHSEADAPSRRLAKPLIFCRTESDCPMENGYARPVEGIHVLVDMQNMVVLEFEDRKLVPLPPADPLRNYTSGETRGGVDRSDVKPLQIVQPEGPSFRVNGHFIQWQKWNFRIGFTPREGLVIYSVAYNDGSRGRRPVAHRLSFVEMVVPYGDPNDPHYRKNAFDAGEDGLGKNAHSLKKGCDCLGYIKYFDAHFTNFYGGVETIENCVCLHEEDHGILWKHQDWRTGLAEVRRSRRLTVSFICTVANYEYGFFWNFYQDGKIEAEVKLTGILSLGALQPGETRKYGTTIAPGLYAPVHQHFFVARMDMAVDCKPGEAYNQVVEVNVKVEEPGNNNVHNNAFYAEENLLKSELEAMRDIDPLSARHWIVRNTRTVNRTGHLTGYKLVPGSNCLPLAGSEAKFLRRAAFLKHNLWVTPYARDEMHPGGEFPNQNPRVGEGLATWVKQNRPLEEADIVLWYIFGVTHIPRLEDWPVMPVERIGFMLMPHGFFNCSPAVDVPPSPSDLDDKENGMPAKPSQNVLIAKL